MELRFQKIPGHPLVAAEILVGVGWRHEPEDLLGISHFLEHVAFRGSVRFPDIDGEAARHGISFGGITHPEATGYNFLSLREDFFSLLSVLLDLVFHPRIAAEDVEAERPIVAGAIGSEADFPPWELVRLRADDLVFETDESRAMGTAETVAHITEEDLRSWHRRYYHAGNVAFLFAGDLEEQEVLHFLEGQGMPEAGESPKVRRVEHKGRVWVREADIPNTELFLAFRLEHNWHTPALRALAYLLANEPPSLLYRKLRTHAPLAYMVDGSMKFLSDVGRLGIYVGVAEPGAEGHVWEALLEIMEVLRRGRIPGDTAAWAEKAAQFDAVYERCDPERALWALRKGVMEGDVLGFDLEGVPDLAQKIFHKSNAYLAVCGPLRGWDPERALAQV